MRVDAEAIKDYADLLAVASRFVQMKKSGAGNWVGLCPFHKEDTPSFTVTPAKRIWKCFGCGEGGDVISLVQKLEHATFPAAVQRVAQLANCEFLLSPVSNTPQPEGRIVAIYHYTDENDETLYEICRKEPGPNGRDKTFVQRYKSGNDFVWQKHPRQVLFRLARVRAADTVYVVEGEKDALTLEGIGLTATTNAGGAKAPWLEQYTESLVGKRVVILPDNDKPGLDRCEKIAAALDKAGIIHVWTVMPSGKDVTEYLQGGGDWARVHDQIEANLRQKERDKIEDRGLLSPEEIVNTFDGGLTAFLDPTKRPPGLKTGFYRLDDMTLGFHPEELILMAARPAMGKTALALNIASHIAGRLQKTVAVFSLEMSRASLLTRLMCACARVDSLKFRAGFLDRNERFRLQGALSEICGWPLYIDDRPNLGLKELHVQLMRLVKDRGTFGLVVIDYLQLMAAKSKENRNQEVATLSRGLKLMAREFKVPFLVLSQLSRGPESRADQRPQLQDLRDSGGLEQDADVVLCLFREEVYKADRPDLRGCAELLVRKQRNGPTGVIKLTYLHGLTKFENRAEDYESQAV